MIVGTSAIVAILRDEADASWCMRVLVEGTKARLSAASNPEAAIVIDGPQNPVLSNNLDVLLEGRS